MNFGLTLIVPRMLIIDSNDASFEIKKNVLNRSSMSLNVKFLY